jgi:hypothetical protein
LLKNNVSSKVRGGRDDGANEFGDENAKDGDEKASDIDDNSKTEELKWRQKMSTISRDPAVDESLRVEKGCIILVSRGQTKKQNSKLFLYERTLMNLMSIITPRVTFIQESGLEAQLAYKSTCIFSVWRTCWCLI